MVDDIERELQAIRTLQETLQPLAPEVRTRVIDYVFRVLGIATTAPTEASIAVVDAETVTAPTRTVLRPRLDGPTDILSLKEEKDPATGTQMIAVVAYYLAHAADESEHQDFITADDIQKYFVQAKYPMPGSLSQALVNAKNAGYLDFVEKGKYRLNSVGYNLVAHKLPKDGTATKATARRRPSKKSAKKAVKKGKQ